MTETNKTLNERNRMHELDRFGVGNFNTEEIIQKTTFIKNVMTKRVTPVHPFISVIVPAHNEVKYILATLRSLAEQTYQNCEFIIISNGEPEDNRTKRIAEMSGFKVIHDPVGGISRARQTGLESARGDIIVTTDADTVHHSQWLKRISEIMSDANIPCGAGLWRSSSKKLSVRLLFSWTAIIWQIKNYLNPRFITGVSEAASFYRRKLAIEAGGYDPSVVLSEGLMMFRKIRKPGVPIIFTDTELIVMTSGRRQEHMGTFRWFWLGFWNATMQLFGTKGIKAEAYPHDIR